MAGGGPEIRAARACVRGARTQADFRSEHAPEALLRSIEGQESDHGRRKPSPMPRAPRTSNEMSAEIIFERALALPHRQKLELHSLLGEWLQEVGEVPSPSDRRADRQKQALAAMEAVAEALVLAAGAMPKTLSRVDDCRRVRGRYGSVVMSPVPVERVIRTFKTSATGWPATPAWNQSRITSAGGGDVTTSSLAPRRGSSGIGTRCAVSSQASTTSN